MTRVLLCFVLLVCVLLCFINPILVAIEMPWKGGLGTVKKSAKPRNFEVENSHGIFTATHGLEMLSQTKLMQKCLGMTHPSSEVASSASEDGFLNSSCTSSSGCSSTGTGASPCARKEGGVSLLHSCKIQRTAPLMSSCL